LNGFPSDTGDAAAPSPAASARDRDGYSRKGQLDAAGAYHGPPDPSLLRWGAFDYYIRNRMIPWRRRSGETLWRGVADAPDNRLSKGADADLTQANEHLLDARQFSRLLQSRFVNELSAFAANHLIAKSPDLSAKDSPARFQVWLVALFACCVGLVWGLDFAAFYVLLATGSFIGVGFVLAVRLLCLAAAARWIPRRLRVPAPRFQAVKPLSDEALPVYSILIPLYKEGEVLGRLVAALEQLDYPRHKLDIKFILEDDDVDTLCAARGLDLDNRYDLIRVPDFEPKTKPKACNYALPFVRGRYVVIFDAEDRPERDQLRKAASRFAVLPDDVVCQQARLAFDNHCENWLTRQFAIEYAVWFHLILPGLYALGLPIPLGGTSNHFRTDALRRIGAWDPYNVTEDADLGMRIASLGLRTIMLTSTTFEEANCEIGNWIRQRSRWQKGFLQTWLVHTRSPLQRLANLGVWRFAGLSAVLLGSVLLGLGPLLAFGFAIGAAMLEWGTSSPLQWSGLAWTGSFLFVLGYVLAFVSGWIALSRAKLNEHASSLVSMPVYWMLIFAGTVKGVSQMLFKPFYWEKTVHGLSSHMPAEPERLGVVGAHPTVPRHRPADRLEDRSGVSFLGSRTARSKTRENR